MFHVEGSLEMVLKVSVGNIWKIMLINRNEKPDMGMLSRSQIKTTSPWLFFSSFLSCSFLLPSQLCGKVPFVSFRLGKHSPSELHDIPVWTLYGVQIDLSLNSRIMRIQTLSLMCFLISVNEYHSCTSLSCKSSSYK